ncbi:restriction endonuclease subunit S [Blautia obeum]|uniref:restriction endonuclease subunit S n=1 Tax=Blautia TaxID=572511 RepID=UPI001D07CECE|nr:MULTISPECIES: restriction endonuclease subunit S [Blautia]MCB6731170.1 restriction endonuclease subunit S [Blautia obeum]MDE8678476.1 restriction endonuclease subunit S [Blautia schinkii]
MRAKLEDVCVRGSSNLKQSDVIDKTGEYPIYGAAGYIGNVDFYHQDQPYVAVVKDGAGIGRTSLYPAESSVIGTMQYLLPKENVLPEYLCYVVKYMHLEKYFTGATIPHIYFKDYKKEEFNLDTLDRQKEIVNILGRIECVISSRQQELQKLDELIKARFVEMFGDVMHNDRKWECKQFSDITTSRLGKMLDAKHQTGTCKYPYLANFNVQWFRFELDNLNEMDFNEKDREEFCLEDGDLLVCEGGEIGRCAVWHNQVKKCFFQKALHRVRCNQDIILPDYLAWWFKYNCENGGFAAIEGAKATISHLTGVKMKMLDVTVPAIELQEQFADFIKQVDKSKVIKLSN